MKTHCLARTVVLALLAVLIPTLVTAVPAGSRNEGINHLFKGYGLDWLSAGVYGFQIKRDVELANVNRTIPVEIQRVTGYLGANLLPWATVYGVGGMNAVKLGSGGSYAGSEAIYGVGARFALLDHRVTEPTSEIDRWRLTAGVEYLLTETRTGNQTWKWQEINAALTVSVVNDLIRNKFFAPESILLYAGPYLSILDGDELEGRNAFGAVAGLEIFVNDSVSLDFKMLILDSVGGGAGINVHF